MHHPFVRVAPLPTRGEGREQEAGYAREGVFRILGCVFHGLPPFGICQFVLL
jgi:hypothetical protein